MVDYSNLSASSQYHLVHEGFLLKSVHFRQRTSAVISFIFHILIILESTKKQLLSSSMKVTLLETRPLLCEIETWAP